MKNNTLPKVTLTKDSVLRTEKMKDGKHNLYVFKCAVPQCHNEIRVGLLKRSTGYCTSCLSKGRPFGILYSRVQTNAKKKGLAFTLTYDEFFSFTTQNRCVYCDSEVSWTKHVNHGSKAESYNLDRRDANKGYTKENLVVCCKTCNWAKNDLFSYEEFLIIGKSIGKVLRARNGCWNRIGDSFILCGEDIYRCEDCRI